MVWYQIWYAEHLNCTRDKILMLLLMLRQMYYHMVLSIYKRFCFSQPLCRLNSIVLCYWQNLISMIFREHRIFDNYRAGLPWYLTAVSVCSVERPSLTIIQVFGHYIFILTPSSPQLHTIYHNMWGYLPWFGLNPTFHLRYITKNRYPFVYIMFFPRKALYLQEIKHYVGISPAFDLDFLYCTRDNGDM